ncbi:MAG: polar amino acid transport system substrate-binding protein [Psychrosphaera sp.]|jgi:polar amino acid transport system substrate-binding protein
MRIIVALFILLIINKVAAKATSITLGYPEFQPFTYTKDGVALGVGIERLKDVGKQLNLDVTFEPIDSYGIAVRFLRENKIDGLALASRNDERDEIAVFSQPITSNNWIWITRKHYKIDFDSEHAKLHIRISTYKNANTHTWLSKHEYKLIYPTTDVNAMLRQLMHNRVDTIFLAEEVFKQALKSSKWKPNDIKTHLEVSKPFGVYISKFFLQQHPNFMERLNKAIIPLTP